MSKTTAHISNADKSKDGSDSDDDMMLDKTSSSQQQEIQNNLTGNKPISFKRPTKGGKAPRVLPQQPPNATPTTSAETKAHQKPSSSGSTNKDQPKLPVVSTAESSTAKDTMDEDETTNDTQGPPVKKERKSRKTAEELPDYHYATNGYPIENLLSSSGIGCKGVGVKEMIQYCAGEQFQKCATCAMLVSTYNGRTTVTPRDVLKVLKNYH